MPLQLQHRKNILVTGGAGYIGAHTCQYLHAQGYCPVVLDSLENGQRAAVKWGPLIQGNLQNTDLVAQVLREYKIAAIIHFAAYAYVGESVENPEKYYWNNVVGTLSLLAAARKAQVRKIVFSSSCATYGVPAAVPILENTPQIPINPYGQSKLMMETILGDYQRSYGMAPVILRYFNAAGADFNLEIGECHEPETHLIPLALQAASGELSHLTVFGSDYPTPDGTCIRDYIHVVDLARAHFLALEYLLAEGPGDIFNLGAGQGFSVKEIIATCAAVTGRPVPVIYGERRPGDPPVLIGDISKAQQILKWAPAHSQLPVIVESAWRWHQRLLEAPSDWRLKKVG